MQREKLTRRGHVRQVIESFGAPQQESGTLTSRIHNSSVMRGEWVTHYHISDEWETFDKFPPHLRGVFDAAVSLVNPMPRWQPESFRISFDEDPLLYTTVVFRAQGSPPMKIPVFGRPSLDLRKVLYPTVAKKARFGMSVQSTEKGLIDRTCIHVTFPHARPVPSRSPIIARALPEFNDIIIKTFPYFKVGDYIVQHQVGNDPWRFQMTLLNIPQDILQWSHKQMEKAHQQIRRQKGKGLYVITVDNPPIVAKKHNRQKGFVFSNKVSLRSEQK